MSNDYLIIEYSVVVIWDIWLYQGIQLSVLIANEMPNLLILGWKDSF